MKELKKYMKTLAEPDKSCSSKWIGQKLKEHFQDLVYFVFEPAVWYVIGRVLKGHLYPASQRASHMQVNPSVNEGSLLMSRIITGNS